MIIKYNSNRFFSKGVTFVELIIVMVFMLAVADLCYLGLKSFRYFSREKASMEVESNAERLVYMIERDVQNCKAITVVSSSTVNDKIQMQMFDYTLGYDVATSDLLNLAKLGSVTYEVKGVGLNRYIEKRISFPTGLNSHHDFLKGMLRDEPVPIFSPGPFGGANPPYQGLQVELPLRIPFQANRAPKNFKTAVLKRVNND